MTDYFCYPVWEKRRKPPFYNPLWDNHSEGYVCFNPAELPLSNKSIAELLRWQAWFDSTWQRYLPKHVVGPERRWWQERFETVLNNIDPASLNFANEKEAEAFEQEGIRLWMQVQRELLPEYEVWYYRLRRDALLRTPDELE
jgi:hypothetical protein